MGDPIFSQQLVFGTELSLSATLFTGAPVSVGTLVEVPSIITFCNDTDQEVFLADNEGSTKGKTMTAGEKMIVDCVTNKGVHSSFLGFVKGKEFFVTAPVGTGAFRIGVLTAE